MKKAVSILFLSTLTLFLASCGSESTTESTDEAGTQQTCFYSYNHGSTTLEWVAFKTNDKVGVPGGFNTPNQVPEKKKSGSPLSRLFGGGDKKQSKPQSSFGAPNGTPGSSGAGAGKRHDFGRQWPAAGAQRWRIGPELHAGRDRILPCGL